MKISIIGSGDVGKSLAQGWIRGGHDVTFGVRNLESFKGKEWLALHPKVQAMTVPEAVKWSEVVVVAAAPEAVSDLTQSWGDVKNKVIIDAMNSIMRKKTPFETTTHALTELSNCENVVKCFNTTGYENLLNPVMHGQMLDMFMAGDSTYAKKIAKQLALDLGFGTCIDFGGSDKYVLLEQLAMVWINLAYTSGLGRDIGFKLMHR